MSARSDPAWRDALFDAMFEKNQSIKLVIDPSTGEIIEANSSACAFYGYPRDELLALRISDLNILPPEAVAAEMAAAASEQRLHFNFRHRLKSGELREVEVYSGPMQLGQRKLLFSIIHDVTARRRAEQELQSAVSTLRSVLDNAQVAIIATSLAGTITHFNPGAQRLLGYSLLEVLGSPLLQLHDPDEVGTRALGAALRFEAFVARLTDGSAGDREWAWVTKSGARVPVLIAARKVLDADARCTGYVVVALDLSALRAQQHERTMLDERLRHLTREIPGAVFQYRIEADNRRSFPYVSQGVEKLLGVTLEALEADPHLLTQLVEPEDLPGLLASVVWGRASFRVRRDGEVRWLYGQATKQREPGGAMLFHGFVTDVTEQKQAEEALEVARREAVAASRVKSDFLANMSHEIRTPLNGILGLTQLVLETHLDPQQRESLETVLRSGNTLLTLINDILDLSRVEAGQLSTESVPFSTDALLADVASVVGPAADEKGLEVLLDARGVGPTLTGDPTRLRQVLTNLLGNAVKFTTRGEVALTLRAVGHGRVRFTVRDTGIGIPPDKRSHLFRPFTQLDTSVSRRYGGTGLGLAISQRLVNVLGGVLELAEGSECGATFTFDLPLAAVQAEAGAASPARVLVASGTALGPHLAELLRFDGATVTVHGGPLPDLDPASADVVLVDTRDPQQLQALKARVPATTRLLQLASLAQLADPLEGVGRLTRPVLPAAARAVLKGQWERPAQPPSAQPAHLSAPLHVLLAEDNPVNAKVVTTLLRRDGHTVEHVVDGRAAINAYAHAHFDVVLMDVMMPDLDGLEATRAIREHERTGARRTPIIALTASAMKGDVERCLEAGMDDFLSKPLNLAQLRTRLAALRPAAVAAPAPR